MLYLLMVRMKLKLIKQCQEPYLQSHEGYRP
jgi:hypothetical protein